MQTIAGLAPGANIIVYHIGSLGDQQIEDAYNKVLTDGKASAVNSSFGVANLPTYRLQIRLTPLPSKVLRKASSFPHRAATPEVANAAARRA